MTRPLRIGYGRVFHEANAFSPLRTELEDFHRMHRLEGAALAEATRLRGSELEGYMPHAELTGFRAAARLARGVETVPLASSLAVPNGPLTRACFDFIVEDLVERIARAGALDGVYLALHGSMEVDGLDEAPEAVILRRVRAGLPGGAKIAASFDLHGNLSAGIVEPLDTLVAYRTNPHWDLAPSGFRAGRRLIQSLRGEIRPTHAWRKLPMVLGGGVTIDFLAPMRGVFRWMRRLERDPRVLSASLFMVHPYTSAPDLGWAVHVATDDDPALAAELADQLADRAWAQRHVELPPMHTVSEALEEAARSPWRKLGPICFVDVDDIVGAGAPGGNTHFAKAFAEGATGLRGYVPVHDPAALEAAWAAGVGARLGVTLRGTPGYGQPEVELDARVARLQRGDFGRIARLDVETKRGGFHVAVSETPPLPIHPKFWRELGLDPRQADVIVQKNFFHYRMFYAATSFSHLPVVTDGATSLSRVRTREYRVPTFPGQDPGDWRLSDRVLREGRVSGSARRGGAGPRA